MVVALPIRPSIKFRTGYNIHNQNNANHYLVQHCVDVLGGGGSSQAFSLISATLKLPPRVHFGGVVQLSVARFPRAGGFVSALLY